MMIHAAPLEARENDPPAHPANCSQKEERRGLPLGIRRMVGLETAAAMLGGKQKLADALGITVRGLSYKFTAERGVSDLDLTGAAAALEARAERLIAHARKLRDEACSTSPVVPA